MTRMLASVADVFECDLVLECGADWIDVKNPHDGALGAAAPSTVRDVVRRVAGRTPVSATIGDCWSTPGLVPERVAALAGSGVEYIKIGVDAAGPLEAMARAFEAVIAKSPDLAIIAVWRAEALPLAAQRARLESVGLAGMMLDTTAKNGAGLTTLLSVHELQGFVDAVRSAGLLCGLAGQLRLEDVASLLPLEADYLGFRSALCERGERTAGLSRDRIDTLVCAVRGTATTGKSQVLMR